MILLVLLACNACLDMYVRQAIELPVLLLLLSLSFSSPSGVWGGATAKIELGAFIK